MFIIVFNVIILLEDKSTGNIYIHKSELKIAWSEIQPT